MIGKWHFDGTVGGGDEMGARCCLGLAVSIVYSTNRSAEDVDLGLRQIGWWRARRAALDHPLLALSAGGVEIGRFCDIGGANVGCLVAQTARGVG